MPTLSYPVAAAIQRLQARADAIKLVGLSVDMQAALATPPRNAPAVYVIASTKGGPIKYAGPPMQQERETTLSLLVWVRNQGNADAVRAEMDRVLEAIDSQFAGWSPGNPPYGELTFVTSRDEFSQAQYLIVQAIYSSSWNFSAPRQP